MKYNITRYNRQFAAQQTATYSFIHSFIHSFIVSFFLSLGQNITTGYTRKAIELRAEQHDIGYTESCPKFYTDLPIDPP